MNIDIDSIRIGGTLRNSFMTPELFETTDFFKNYNKERWGDYRLVKVPLVYWLDELRDIAGAPVNIHCAYEDRVKGYHPLGLACDFHVSGMSVIDQFIIASKLPFNGIGLYPYWNQRGLHVDIRPADVKYFWYRDKHMNYHEFKSMQCATSTVWY